MRCFRVVVSALPRRASSLTALAFPLNRLVGIHIFCFEACSSFTHVTACPLAHPPLKMGFVTRLRLSPLPDSAAR
jgi:hypothetical protein